ncbi:MAG: sigma factor-like helix-turn-helix DNA-binding protein [Methylococcales bacterium]
MDEGVNLDISEYYQLPLANLVLPGSYKKLIKRIMGLNGLKNTLGEKINIETVADIVNLEPYQVLNCQGIGKHYVETLIEFKKELPCLLSKADSTPKCNPPKLKQEPNAFFTDDILASTDNSYDFTTPINQLALSPKYQKLIKRISTVMENIDTVKDIIDIDVAGFSKLPAVGTLYVDSLISLQNALSPTDSQSSRNIAQEIKLPPQTTLSKLYINYGFLSEKEIKQLIKLEKYYGGDVDIRNVSTLLNLDKVNLAKQVGFGALFMIALNGLQNKIKNTLIALPENLTEYTIKHRGLFISSEFTFIEFDEIDNILIEDIEGYLWTLDEMKMDIALSRWGFNQQHETLEEVGDRYKITRERIRQLEKGIHTNLPLNFRIQPKVLLANIREKMTEDLTTLLPNLAKCFSTEKLFYAFIELCCQVENGSIFEITTPKVNNKILNPIFCTNPSPIAQEIILNELMSNYGYSKASAIQSIKQLKKNDKIKITEQGIYPKNLGKVEAVAHVLTFHPAGLPWKDIARIVNKKGYSSTPFDETRQTPSALTSSEYIYLCGLGTYRNLIFLDFEQINIPEILQHLLAYFKQHQLTALHLNDYYYQSKIDRSSIEYFTLRHLVREHGEDYGLYFEGKSGSDSVSLDPDLKRITQADVIIKVLNESKVAMTRQEIAERLRSKSTAHAGFYLNDLMEEGKVVRVDQMVYTTPEKAFSNIDKKAIMQVIQDIMSASNIIVEADIFREYVNMELNLSYSKYFYMALVRSQLKELGWYRNNTLFSKKHIQYNNLVDMCRKLCNPDLSKHENAKILQQAAWLTDAVTSDAIQQWKWQITH